MKRLLLVLVMVLAACGSDEKDAAPTAATTAPAITVTDTSAPVTTPAPATTTTTTVAPTTTERHTGGVQTCGAGKLFQDADGDGWGSCQAPTTTVPVQLEVSGVFTLLDIDVDGSSWKSCHGTGGYDDFGPGMNITVRDGNNNVIGTGETRSLRDADLDDPDIGSHADIARDDGGNVVCVVAFEVPIKDAEFYQIEIGDRGDLTYSKDELEAVGWVVFLDLGGS